MEQKLSVDQDHRINYQDQLQDNRKENKTGFISKKQPNGEEFTDSLKRDAEILNESSESDKSCNSSDNSSMITDIKHQSGKSSSSSSERFDIENKSSYNSSAEVIALIQSEKSSSSSSERFDIENLRNGVYVKFKPATIFIVTQDALLNKNVYRINLDQRLFMHIDQSGAADHLLSQNPKISEANISKEQVVLWLRRIKWANRQIRYRR